MLTSGSGPTNICAFLVENHAPHATAFTCIVITLALQHPGMVFLTKEVAVSFQADQGSAGTAYHPTSSPDHSS